MKLFQREECPHCVRVRAVLAKHNVTFESAYVPRLGSQRVELTGHPGATSAEVPALLDGDTLIQGTEKIIAHVEEKYGSNGFGDPKYGLTRVFEGMAFGDAVGSVKAALTEAGFGVLTEIDVKATMKKKLDVDFQNYVILGACNPPLAHQALTAEPAIGLLLPCNVVVTEDSQGNAIVSAIDPKAMFKVLDRDDIEPLAMDVRKRLASVLTSMDGATG